MIFDVVIVGASIAGCTAAIMFAKRGASVALLDRKVDTQSYKKICTHFLQPSAVPTIERLGLFPLLSEAGATRPSLDIWTPWGWISDSDRKIAPGFSIRRKKLDPILLDLANNTPGVKIFLGHSLKSVIRENGRTSGVVTTDREGKEHSFCSKLVVGADGRQSHVAESAKVSTMRFKNRRSAFYCYFNGVNFPEPDSAKAWYSDPHIAIIFPTDNAITIASVMPVISDCDDWNSGREEKLIKLVESMPGAPSLSSAERVTPVFGMADMPVIWRKSSNPGLALIGDAAFAADPIWGVGCGWAFQSAEWLVDCVAEDLQNIDKLDTALKKYHRMHRWRLGGHALHMISYASGRKFYGIEKFLFSAASKGEFCANKVHAYGNRNIGLTGLLNLKVIYHAAKTHLGSRTSAFH